MTREGELLTDAHRVAQTRLRATSVAELVALWPMLDPKRLDDTFPGYLAAMRALVGARRAEASLLTAAYLRAYRAAEGASGTFAPALAGPVNPDALETSLRVTGPVTIKRATGAGRELPEAARTALSQTAGTLVRQVANASRETTFGSMRRDSASKGWARVTDGKACAFCAMLASRGPVYSTKGTADFQTHDRCGCEPVLVYSGDGWTDQSRFYRQVYDEAKAANGGRVTSAQFRQFYEGRSITPSKGPAKSGSRSGSTPSDYSFGAEQIRAQIRALEDSSAALAAAGTTSAALDWQRQRLASLRAML